MGSVPKPDRSSEWRPSSSRSGLKVPGGVVGWGVVWCSVVGWGGVWCGG